MKKSKITNLILLVIMVAAILLGCETQEPVDSKSNTIEQIEPQEATTNPSEQATNSQEIEELSEYGILQEVVDSYGFPFYFENTEGMEKTEIRLFESYAQRHWTSNNQQTLHENLVWNLIGNTLQVSGQWEESFLIDMTTGKATSLTDGKEYRLVVYDENGDGHGYVE